MVYPETFINFPRYLTTRLPQNILHEQRISEIIILEILDFMIIICTISENNFDAIWFRSIEENNTGVLGRPWTKRKVLRAISSTLKFQFTEHHDN